jgi:hypothetical protein
VLKIYIQTVLRVLTIAFGAAYSITGITLVVGLAHMKGEHTAWLYVLSLIVIPAGMTWNPIVNTCIVARVDPLMIATAAAPLAFELLMLVCICLNAFDRPRAVGVSLRHDLYHDGIVFFLVCICFFPAIDVDLLTMTSQISAILRSVQLAMVTTLDPALGMLGILSVSLTSIVSIVFNQRAFVRLGDRNGTTDTTARVNTPLPLRSLDRFLTRNDKTKWATGGEVELGRIDIELHTSD